MSLFSKLFAKKESPEAERMRPIIAKAREKYQSAAQSPAFRGAEIRERILSLIEKVEAEMGQWAIAFPETADKGKIMMVAPQLLEEMRQQPDSAVLEPALSLCFPTPYSTQQNNASWPSIVKKYQRKSNTEELLRSKAALLVCFITSNLNIATELYVQLENVPELTEEQEGLAKLEEAVLWYRVIDELAHGYLAKDRPLFMDYFHDRISETLGLQGIAPNVICTTMQERIREYGQYRKWIPEGEEGSKDTLLWEAAKHVAAALGVTRDNNAGAYLGFLTFFGNTFLQQLENALILELLTGRTEPHDSPRRRK